MQGHEEQQQLQQDISLLSETVRDLAGRAAGFERRLAKMEVSGQDEVPPPPPAVHYPHVPTAPPVVRTYEMPPSQMSTIVTV